MQANCYEVLGCDKESSHEEIKCAYHARLLQFHPDKNDDSKDTHKFHEVQEAWKVLGHPQRRREYDAARKQQELENENVLVYARLAVDELENNTFGGFFYPCRCGDHYFVQPEDLRKRDSVLQVTCEGCTLVILVET